jgi:isoleucyl-tRNA synthetase
MPYAQKHYPFEGVKEFNASFPADFIAEGIDQTRGWFYTLLVISTALFGKPAFKNLIANGLILASDGQKMSKRKKNYPDPMEIMDKYGADALRLYLINSPVVRAENLRFKEEGVRDVIKDVFLPWYNAFRFLMQNIARYEHDEKTSFAYKNVNELCQLSSNTMDRWILSFTETQLRFLNNEMKAYHLYTVVPRLVKYIDNLTNWYVRMNRKRIKGDFGPDDCHLALNTLFHVLYTMVRINAPFTPFLAEFMFQRLRKYLPELSDAVSVHYQMIPDACERLIDEKIERAVLSVQAVIELARVVRDRRTLPVKYPLPELVVIHQEPATLEDLGRLKPYVLEEVNVKELVLTSDKTKYGVSLRAEPDYKSLGGRLKGEFKAVTTAIKELSDEELQRFVSEHRIEVLGHELGDNDLRLIFSFGGPAAKELSKRYEAHSDGDILILLDVTPDETMLNEGLAREIINRVQKLRKKAKLLPMDAATLYYDVKAGDSDIASVIVSHKEFIESTTKTPQKTISEWPKGARPIIEETLKVKGVDIYLALVADSATPGTAAAGPGGRDTFSKYVNVELVGMEPRFGAASPFATVLLENFDNKPITCDDLKAEVTKIFGIHGCGYELRHNGRLINDDEAMDVLRSLTGTLVHAVKVGESPSASDSRPIADEPFCRFINVQNKEKKTTVLLENPRDSFTLDHEKLRQRLELIFPKSDLLLPPVSALQLHGFTIHL